MIMHEKIRSVDLSKHSQNEFKNSHVGCIVISRDRKIMLQQRGLDWDRFPGCLATFGGEIKTGEEPFEALVRELHEELGAIVVPGEIIQLGAITDIATHHEELMYANFWYDKTGTITGCYEGEARFYDNCGTALQHPKIMNDAKWMLLQCRDRNLLPD